MKLLNETLCYQSCCATARLCLEYRTGCVESACESCNAIALGSDLEDEGTLTAVEARKR